MTAALQHTSPPSAGEAQLVEALRRGDEDAFRALVESYHTSLVRLAMAYVRSRTVAEEVAQETWLAVINGIDRFEMRSSLKTWIFRILANCAQTRGVREARSVPFSAVEDAGPAVEAERFLDAGPHAGHWTSSPVRWDLPEDRLLGAETRTVIAEAIEALPTAQRTVISLRDVEGWSSAEVCELLGLTEVNQRVLLHRARSVVRRALERYFESR